MIDKALGQKFRQQVLRGKGAVIDTVDRGLAELAVAAIFALRQENVFWLVGENENATEIAEKIGFWLHFIGQYDVPVRTHALPFQDPYVNREPDMHGMEEKARLLAAWQAGKRAIVITTLAALSVPVERRVGLDGLGTVVKAGATVERTAFLQKLADFGYYRKEYVEGKGEVAWRGNVVDVFPLTAEYPVRIEFEADRILSLRFFDQETQRSVSSLADFFLFSPLALRAGDMSASGSIMDSAIPFCLVSRDFQRLHAEFIKLQDHLDRIRQNLPDAGRLPPAADFFCVPVSREEMIDLPDFPYAPTAKPVALPLRKNLRGLTAEDLEELRQKIGAGFRVHLYSDDRKLAENILRQLELCEPHDLLIPCSFVNLETRSLFLTAREYRYVERPGREKVMDSEKWMREIQAGDIVVHRVHGIGKFCGCQRLSFEGVSQEFLKVEYQHSEYLYIPMYELDTLSRYQAFEGQLPALDRLGGKTWRIKVYRAKRNIADFARELLDLYALRRSVKGSAHPPQAEFEDRLQETFSFVETEDQKRAICETLADLEGDSPMDRLVCGDVSFGKTEVALRAAARVVANQRQVAFLCPTTILAYQHFQTFSRRFKDLPVVVAMLSRLVGVRERKEILEKLRRGQIDILIGTHALLSGPVEFKALGLYIIDEEQRFGVFQKEKLKKKRENVDVLVLTATPIPRTLSLALSGLQDISLIRSPPLGRLSVQNFIGYFSREVVVSAVLSEVERDGLVYIVYNDIDRILDFRDKLQAWLPDIPVVVLHAQLPTPVIERNLLAFIQRRFRILLSTTIIENGIDIPAVNTLIVIDADRFGLTQLYQLRGRIGRSDRQAYAYFLVGSGQSDLSDKARKRLEAIRDFSHLGSGYKIAEFDLRLRGAGSLLGRKQHGHIEALGFDYYLELIQQTVQTLRGVAIAKFVPELAVHFAYTIPETYIDSPTERLHVYRRILEARQSGDFFAILEELQDQYGHLPESMERLFTVGAVKLFAQKFFWKRIEVYHDKLLIEPLQPHGLDATPLPDHAPFRTSTGGLLRLPVANFARFVRDCESWPLYFPTLQQPENLQKP